MIYFIIGTDTDCGKTTYGTTLAKDGYHVIKPIETGSEDFLNISDSDSGKYAEIQNKSLSDINLYFFKKACSPHLAASIDSEVINANDVKDFIKSKCSGDIYVELAGGLMVPLTNSYTQLDLIKDIDCEVILVSGIKLGAINHTLLTIDVLRQNNIKIKEVIYNDFGISNYRNTDSINYIKNYLEEK